MSHTTYLDAFDETIVTHDDLSSDYNDSYSTYSGDDDDVFLDDDVSDDDEKILSDSDSYSLYSDDDDDFSKFFDDFEITPRVKSEPSKEERINHLNKIYKDDLEKCHKALEGKLNWVTSKPSIESVADINEFPNINVKPNQGKRLHLKKILKKNIKPLNINIKIKPNKPSQINMYVPRKKLPLKKKWFCKNLIQTGECRFGNKCIFAHTLKEIENHTEKCKFGHRCNNVSKISKNEYINNGYYKCIHRHPNENINNFIKRVQ